MNKNEFEIVDMVEAIKSNNAKDNGLDIYMEQYFDIGIDGLQGMLNYIYRYMNKRTEYTHFLILKSSDDGKTRHYLEKNFDKFDSFERFTDACFMEIFNEDDLKPMLEAYINKVIRDEKNHVYFYYVEIN